MSLNKTIEKQLFSKDFSDFSSIFYSAIMDTTDLEIDERTKTIAKRLSTSVIKDTEIAMLLYLIMMINEYISTTYANMCDELNKGIADLFLAHVFVLSFNKFHYFRQDEAIETDLRVQGKLCSYLYSYCLLIASSDLMLKDAIENVHVYYTQQAYVPLQKVVEMYFIIIDELEYLKESFETTYQGRDLEDTKIVRMKNEDKGNSTVH